MPQNKSTNNGMKREDPSTYTAYGDPVKSSLPPITDKFKQANSTIDDERTQRTDYRKG